MERAERQGTQKPTRNLKPPWTLKPHAEFSATRSFLAHSGILSQLRPLQASEDLLRGINSLDADSLHDSLSIGVTYVGPLQRSECEVLQNSSGTAAFQEFVQGLGNCLELASHLGGLDCKGSNGTATYSDWERDVIFHVVPLVPTALNGIVFIVWTENCRDYSTETILNNSNAICIVIYPFESGLFRVKIHSKVQVVFGPLQDGMVLPLRVLATLVRETAVYAHIQVCELQGKGKSKPQLRKRKIQELIERFALDNYS